MPDIINETFKRVEKSLDLRFEKDTSLYIDKKSTDEIKENLSNNHYQNISAIAKKTGNAIVTKVIIKNSWLVEFKFLKKQDKTILNEILTSTEDSFFVKEADVVIKDSIYSSIEFKKFIEKIYYNKLEKEDCYKIFLNVDIKVDNRALCFIRHMKEIYINEVVSSYSIKQFINIELINNPEVLVFLNKNPSLGNVLFKNHKEQRTLSHWIVNDLIKSNNDSFWTNVFMSIKDYAFQESINYIKEHPDYKNSTTKLLILNILPRFSSEEDFNSKIVNLYRDEDTFHIRILLIRMLRPPRFKNKEQAQNILGIFEAAHSFRDNWMEDVEKVREWGRKVKKDNIRFINTEEFNNDIVSSSRTIKKGNIPTFDYFKAKLSKSRMRIIEAIINENKNTIETEKVLCYFFANLLRKKGEFIRIDPEGLKLSDSYINSISNWIDNLDIKTDDAKMFLAKHGKIEILKRLDRR